MRANEDILSKFNELGLSEKLLDVLAKIGFETPTPIQEEAIPLLLENDPTDFIGLAQTGTGKTAAFGLPLLDLIDENSKDTLALIMAPTRELGQQIAQQLKEFSKNHRKLSIEVVYGGAHISRQIKALKSPTQIVVATPGRLLDLIRRKAIKLNSVEYVILDEADEMLNMGFKEDIDDILEHTGKEKSIWLFSATMPSTIRRIIKKYMDDPLEAKVNTNQISNADITHQYVVCRPSNKIIALRRFLDLRPDMRGVMFCRTKRDTEQFADSLKGLGYNVAALNGDMSQGQRDKVMKMFKNRAMQLLIATDVAARGIDVKDLNYVIHHTLPDQLEYYTHRSGRTGRAGNKGISLAFTSSREKRRIKEIENRIKINFEKVEIPSHEEVIQSRIHKWSDKLLSTEINLESEQIYQDLEKQFGGVSKEELLKKLISSQMHTVSKISSEKKNLNEKDEERSSSKDRNKKRSKKNSHRYFINIGRIDGFSKAELVEFIEKHSGVNQKHFSDITLQSNCAYFDAEKKYDSGLSAKFKDVEINDRLIRVNRDDQSSSDKKHTKRSGKKKDRRYSNPKSKRKNKSKKKRDKE